MKFGEVGKKLYLVAGACTLAAVAIHYMAPDFFAMCAASCVRMACLLLRVAECVMLAAPALGLAALIKVRRAYKKGVLVTDGMYSVCRHPVYAIFLVWLCGVALTFRSWILLLVPLVTYLAARILIRAEERSLVRRFGEAYIAYQKAVNPLFPTLRRRRRCRRACADSAAALNCKETHRVTISCPEEPG